LTAGSAVPWVSGLSFGIDAAYKQGTDLVLLAFLITAALVEYLADSFLRFWQRLATELSQDASERLRVSLGKRHWKSMSVISAAFAVMALSAWIASVAVAVGLAVNLLIGYGLSHLWGVQYAAVGLVVGSATVLWIANTAVRRILHHPDYHYSIS
jgi:uncharacterized membrane protein YdjX (TVP38/TMEM64 family)